MLTTCSMAFVATLGEVFNIADVAGLKLYIVPHWYAIARPERYWEVSPRHNRYFMFQDSQTGGGGCRIVFMLTEPLPVSENYADDLKGLAWITRHSGYPEADITAEVAQLFDMTGCKEYSGTKPNPYLNLYA